MHSWLRRRLSFANLMATAAMFLALGGTATAVVTALPANSVGTKQLKDKAVTSAKVHPGTLTTEYIARDGAANGTTMYGPVSGSGER
jgi:osmotically-inducible protein OsmY